MKRNYYTVNIPSDCEQDKEKRFNLAILEIKDRARKFFLPCQWVLVWDDGEHVRIKRIHR